MVTTHSWRLSIVSFWCSTWCQIDAKFKRLEMATASLYKSISFRKWCSLVVPPQVRSIRTMPINAGIVCIYQHASIQSRVWTRNETEGYPCFSRPATWNWFTWWRGTLTSPKITITNKVLAFSRHEHQLTHSHCSTSTTQKTKSQITVSHGGSRAPTIDWSHIFLKYTTTSTDHG